MGMGMGMGMLHHKQTMIHCLKFALKRQRKKRPMLIEKRKIILTVARRYCFQAVHIHTESMRECIIVVANPAWQCLVEVESRQVQSVSIQCVFVLNVQFTTQEAHYQVLRGSLAHYIIVKGSGGKSGCEGGWDRGRGRGRHNRTIRLLQFSQVALVTIPYGQHL